jgi:hypothetical protein
MLGLIQYEQVFAQIAWFISNSVEHMNFIFAGEFREHSSQESL